MQSNPNAVLIIPLERWERVTEEYRRKLKEWLCRFPYNENSIPTMPEQAERIFMRCIGKLDGTYTGEY